VKKKTINKEIFGKRLSQLMEGNNETTYTMAEEFSLSSPTISRYVTGQMAAKITTIESMARYFNVNPVWLMGYDVSKNLENSSEKAPQILEYYNILNETGKRKVCEYALDLSEQKKYTEPEEKINTFPVPINDNDHLSLNAAHTDESITPTPEMIQEEEDIMDDENF